MRDDRSGPKCKIAACDFNEFPLMYFIGIKYIKTCDIMNNDQQISDAFDLKWNK